MRVYCRDCWRMVGKVVLAQVVGLLVGLLWEAMRR